MAPSTTTNKWGPENLNASSTQQIGGSTYNITNNNNINYNYGSNITAISSEGSVPTFQDLEKNKNPSYGSQLTSALSSVAKSEYLNNAAKTVQNSQYLSSASDTIKRAVGVDIRRALGGKTAAEIAEERIKKD